MKLNSTATYTFILLFLMLGAGAMSATWGFSLGSEALKGVTQPDSRPNKGNPRRANNQPEEIAILKEADIIKDVKERTNGSAKAPAEKDIQAKIPNQEAPPQQPASKFPFISKDKGITLEVTALRRQGDTVVFDVSLRNEGDQPVKFLYSFLNITDDQGQILTGETAGLPMEIPAKSAKLTGTVSVSSVLLANAERVSLQLSDYPDQKVQLEMSDIPVK
ncbi:MAG: hypothetical protein VKJ24_09140 [Synechococcales bacterium]|nr:hypothetical protein [Synechococcales bacterium]